VAPLSRRGLVLLATAGGIVPSPSAVIVLVSAFTLGRVGLGLALVAAFSVGLAATLTAVGLALVFGSRAMGGVISARLVRVLPVAGAVALVVLGAVLTVQGVRGI
jgi:ABC-type nickel/cobalt efflux system permease component RcnA